MHVHELNTEFNTPLDLVKVIVERHKPYHSADITVEQRAFQITEKVRQIPIHLIEKRQRQRERNGRKEEALSSRFERSRV